MQQFKAHAGKQVATRKWPKIGTASPGKFGRKPKGGKPLSRPKTAFTLGRIGNRLNLSTVKPWAFPSRIREDISS